MCTHRHARAYKQRMRALRFHFARLNTVDRYLSCNKCCIKYNTTEHSELMKLHACFMLVVLTREITYHLLFVISFQCVYVMSFFFQQTLHFCLLYQCQLSVNHHFVIIASSLCTQICLKCLIMPSMVLYMYIYSDLVGESMIIQ